MSVSSSSFQQFHVEVPGVPQKITIIARGNADTEDNTLFLPFKNTADLFQLKSARFVSCHKQATNTILIFFFLQKTVNENDDEMNNWLQVHTALCSGKYVAAVFFLFRQLIFF